MSSLYQSMVAVIEQSITPLAGKLGQQKYVIAIRDGFTAALPFMIIGSFMLVFIFPPFSAETTNSFARGWLDFSATYREQLMLPFNLSMGVMTFFISVGIGASLGRQFNLDPIMSGLLAFMAFLLVAAPYADGKISTQYLSGQGIFTALITAIYATRVYAWLKQHNITIRLPKEVPTGVARSFEILIPVLVVIATLHPLNLFIEAQTGMIIPQAIMHQAALAAGAALPHVYLQGFWDHYLLIGGVGSTLPLAFLLLRSRVTHLRTIGKMGIVPSFFNINEPILFGAPIIMNPMLFIPFVFVPMINAVLAYTATRLGWLDQVVSLTPWTTPAPIGASWAANWAFSPVVMCLICMVMSALIYLPFLRAYERSLLKTEEQKAQDAVSVANAARSNS